MRLACEAREVQVTKKVSAQAPTKSAVHGDAPDDVPDASQQQNSSETGRGDADEPAAQHEADDADSESSRRPLIVPDDLQRSLTSHSDLTFVQLGQLLGFLPQDSLPSGRRTKP